MTHHPAATTEPAQSPATDKPAKLAAIVLGLTAVISLMLLAFATPSLNSGASDLPLAVSGPSAGTAPLIAMLEENSPGTFDVTMHDNAEDGAEAIRNREAIGGIAITEAGVTIQTAAGAGSTYKALLTGLGSQMAANGQTVTFAELAPTTDDDPAGSAIASLGLPLVFGGLAASAALLLAYRGRMRNRLVAVSVLAVLAGLATTAILRFGFGVFDSGYWLISGAVAAGIVAIAFPVLGLFSKIGIPGLGIMAVLLMFVANPLAGLATGPDWLPGGWGDFGQFLPIGAAGTAIRSAAYFDGAGATQAWIVMAVWAALGLALALTPGRKAPQA